MFAVKNQTGSSVTLGGTTYASGSWIDLTAYISENGIKYTRNDIDGPNAGRGLDGLMIRDRVATKGKWEVQIRDNTPVADSRVIMNLVYPETFLIKTDFPTGVQTQYTVYTNNIPVQFQITLSNGTHKYTSISIPFVEV